MSAGWISACPARGMASKNQAPNIAETPSDEMAGGRREAREFVLRWKRRALDVVIVLLANIKFAAHNRLHTRSMRRVHKMHRAKNIAVVSHGHGRHAHLLHALAKLFDIAGAIEQRIIGM